MRRLRQVVIAQPVSAGGTQYLVQIFQVLLNQDGTFAQQALQLAASATVNSPFSQPLLALSVVAGNFDGTIQPAGGLPQDELVVVAMRASSSPSRPSGHSRHRPTRLCSTLSSPARSCRRTRFPPSASSSSMIRSSR